jgi:hypothetical protein
MRFFSTHAASPAGPTEAGERHCARRAGPAFAALALAFGACHGSSSDDPPPPPPQGPAFYVAPNGDDQNPGTETEPWRTLARGLSGLVPGDTLLLRGGTYFESATVSVSGTALHPITIRSFPGELAILDSGPRDFRTPGNGDWELVNAAIGEYRSANLAPSGTPYGYVAGIPGYENGRVGLVPYVSATAFRATSETWVNGSTQYYVGPGLFRDAGTGRLHIRLQKTAAMRAVEARYGQVFPLDFPDPRDYPILVSQGDSTLTLRGSHLVIRDLAVNQARRAIDLPSTVEDVRIENVEVWLGDAAIDCRGAGSHDITVTQCRVYGDVPRWIFWTDAKVDPAPADLMRQTSIDFSNGAHDVEVAFNHVRGGHDLVGVNSDERDFQIHHNVLQNCADDACEFEGTTDIGRIEFHHNYVLNGLVAISPGQDTPATTGPMLFHHNVFVELRLPPVNRQPGIVSWNGGAQFDFEYMFKQHSGNTFYYDNTMVMLSTGSGQGINITPLRPASTYCANNIMVMVNGRVTGSYRTAAGQIVDGNLYWKVNTVDATSLMASQDTVPALFAATGLEQNGIGSLPRRGTDPQFAALQLNVANPAATVWQLDAASEVQPITAFALRAGSPARNAAIPIPVHPVFGALPEANDSRDLGALPFGASLAVYGGFPFDQVR